MINVLVHTLIHMNLIPKARIPDRVPIVMNTTISEKVIISKGKYYNTKSI